MLWTHVPLKCIALLSVLSNRDAGQCCALRGTEGAGPLACRRHDDGRTSDIVVRNTDDAVLAVCDATIKLAHSAVANECFAELAPHWKPCACCAVQQCFHCSGKVRLSPSLRFSV